MVKDNQDYPFAGDFFSTDPRRQSVLIVEDVEHTVSNASLALGDLCEVLWADSGWQAIRLAKTHRPDLIMLSTRMPDMDGFEIIKLLRVDKETRSIPVVFMSKEKDEAQEAEGFALGAIDYITTPQSASILQARISIHLRADLQRKKLERLAQFDGLTGVLNRRVFDHLLAQCWDALLDSDEPLSLLFIDIDYFKQINDTFGHLSGDDVLRLVATTITQQVDLAVDIVARYGGEEFSCLLPGKDLSQARSTAEKIRQAVNLLTAGDSQNGTARFLSVSIGIACTVAQSYQSSQELIAGADQRLYFAKRQGRNQIVS